MLVSIGNDTKRPETVKPKPWKEVLWHVADVSTLKYTEFVVAQVCNERKLQAYTADFDHRGPGLTYEFQLPADALFCATGGNSSLLYSSGASLVKTLDYQ